MDMRVFILLIFVSEIAVSAASCRDNWFNIFVPMSFVDNANRLGSGCPTDTFYDRIVSIFMRSKDKSRYEYMETYPTIATGVIISDKLVLTSFNAFRSLSNETNTLKHARVLILTGRVINRVYKIKSYWMYGGSGGAKISCARQVVPSNYDDPIPPGMKHGRNQPVHDLMVIRLSERISTFRNPERMFDFSQHGIWTKINNDTYEYKRFGPIKTEIALPTDDIGDEITFASAGHRDFKHIIEYRRLVAEVYRNVKEKHIIVDCYEWIPREWGYFICVSNVDNFVGIGSGAMLFSNEKLFGVGSFAVFKDNNKQSILVFTDVRPYRHLLYETCLTNGYQ